MRRARCLAVLIASATALTACHGDCYMVRDAASTGMLGDTVTAVAGSEGEPGAVRVFIIEQAGLDREANPFRYAELRVTPLVATDTATLYRLTRISDEARTPLLERTASAHGLVTSTIPTGELFDMLFAGLGAEDVLFEVQLKSGTTSKARLKAEERHDAHKYCEPYT